MRRSILTFFAGIGLAGVFLAGPTFAADTQFQQAIKAGAIQLTSTEIAELIVGNTVKAKSGNKTFLFHYGRDNIIAGKLLGGNWSGNGYYGITDDDRVCLSMAKDKGRLRCMTLVRNGRNINKYNVAGKMAFEFLDVQNGKKF